MQLSSAHVRIKIPIVKNKVTPALLLYRRRKSEYRIAREREKKRISRHLRFSILIVEGETRPLYMILFLYNLPWWRTDRGRRGYSKMHNCFERWSNEFKILKGISEFILFGYDWWSLGKMRFEKSMFLFYQVFKVEFTLFSLIMNFLSFWKKVHKRNSCN